MTMTFKSANAYPDFAKSVKQAFRYIRTKEQEDFLGAVGVTSTARTITMTAGNKLWRAQLGHDWRAPRDDEPFEDFPTAYSPDRMKPLLEKASDGRANTRGIPCLYLATDQDTAILEVRPLIGSFVSVAQFTVVNELRLIDCSRDLEFNRFVDGGLPAEDWDKAVWSGHQPSVFRAC